MSTSDTTTAQAQDKAQEVAGQAKEQAGKAADQAKEQVRTQVDQRSTQAGEQVVQQAGDIRTVAEQLREQGKDKPAQLAEQAADRAERLGTYLRESDADRILGDVEDFARQRPWAVIAGGIAVGVVASRFLKASQGERYRSSAARGGNGAVGSGSQPGTSMPAGSRNTLSSGVPVGSAGAAPPVPPAPQPPTPSSTPPAGGL